MSRILTALAVLAVILVALRRREEPAVMRPAHERKLLGSPTSANPAKAYGLRYYIGAVPHLVDPDADLQPGDPYPASLLP
jgi:hypothetical protein